MYIKVRMYDLVIKFYKHRSLLRMMFFIFNYSQSAQNHYQGIKNILGKEKKKERGHEELSVRHFPFEE